MLMMKRLLGFCCAFTLGTSGFAQGLDYSASGNVGLPLTLNAQAWLGYGLAWWGQKENGNWRYGYLRPHTRVVLAPGVARGDLRLDVFPISIAGLTFGQAFTSRDKNYKDEFNCHYVACSGTLSRTYVEAKLKGAYENFFAVLTGRLDALTAGVKNRGFVDEATKLDGAQGYDLLRTGNLQAGYRLSPRWPVGVYGYLGGMERTQAWAYEVGTFARFEENESWNYRLQVGMVERRTKSRHLNVGLQVSWVGLPSIEL